MLAEPAATPGAPHLALWNLGFRPFYLLAGSFAAISILCWVGQFAGWLGGHSYLRGPLWHAHEMIFGFAFAVITGFLFTAVRNWTNEPTPTGGTLLAIATLWLAGRLLAPTPWPMLAAAADTAFAIAAAAGIALPMYASRNRRNYFFVALLLAMGAVNLVFHLAMAGIIDFPVQRGLQAGLDIVLIIMAIMGGRVIPMFTANGVPGTQPRRMPWVERTAMGSLILLAVVSLIASLVPVPPAILGGLAMIAAVSHAIRLGLWQPLRTFGNPLVWILHASFAWIVIHLLLRALAAFDIVPVSAATHALTVGAIGGLTLGMMTRTARGHSGLPLKAGRAEAAAYVLIQIAAFIRALLPIAAPGLTLWAITASGLLWTAAFTLFVVKYAPILWRPRVDGRPG